MAEGSARRFGVWVVRFLSKLRGKKPPFLCCNEDLFCRNRIACLVGDEGWCCELLFFSLFWGCDLSFSRGVVWQVGVRGRVSCTGARGEGVGR